MNQKAGVFQAVLTASNGASVTGVVGVENRPTGAAVVLVVRWRRGGSRGVLG